MHPPVPGVRVDRLDLLRLCLFMPALSFIFVHPPSPLSIPLLRLASSNEWYNIKRIEGGGGMQGGNSAEIG